MSFYTIFNKKQNKIFMNLIKRLEQFFLFSNDLNCPFVTT